MGADLVADTGVDVRADAQRLPFRDGAVDLAICYHVLEHVRDDRRAMAELSRVLAPGGFAIVQVPIRRGAPTDEAPDAPVAARVRRFGQEDHVRYYGDDFERRLEDAGLHPTSVAPSDLVDRGDVERMSLVPDEEVWVCFHRPLERRAGEDLPDAIVRTSLALERQARDRAHRDLVATLRRARRSESALRSTRRTLDRIRSHPAVRAARRLRRALRRLRRR